jgi:hypothetical protein
MAVELERLEDHLRVLKNEKIASPAPVRGGGEDEP